MPARKYATPEESYRKRLEQNNNWRKANLEKAQKACTDWHIREKEAGRKPNSRSKRNPKLLLLSHAKKRAKAAGLEYELTREWLFPRLEPMICERSGLPLSFENTGPTRVNPWTPSIDRIDSSLGYVPDNCQIVCWAYNLMKSSWTDAHTLKLAQAIVDFSK